MLMVKNIQTTMPTDDENKLPDESG